MADKTPDQEPSIEEILASIRQIISDDEEKDSEPAVAAAPPPPPPAPPPKPPAPPAPEPVFEPVVFAQEEDDVLELTERVEEEPEEETFEIDLQDQAPEPEEVEMPAPRNSSLDDILTETARTATISSMAKLAGNMPITRHREYGNITLEDLVREMLHPMLRDWLSESLPPMVERMVQKELEKLARQAQDV